MGAKRRGALFINRTSGSADAARADAIKAAATDAGIEPVDLHPGLDLFAEIRGRVDRGERRFIAAGGDGTVNAVVQPLVGTEGELAVLPVGTWNHFARDIGLELDWEEAMKVALNGEVRQIDVGRANDRFFVNNLSIGLYPELVQHREKLRRYGKWRAYLKATRAALRKFPHVALSIETPHRLETIKTHVFMVSVNPYDLTLPGVMAPRKTLDGGSLSVYWLPHMPKLEFIMTVARYFRGRTQGEGTIRSLQTTQLRIQLPESKVRVGLDGELRDLAVPMSISILRGGLNVCVPRIP